MTVTYHRDLIQGSDEWIQARCGLLTASEMRLIITPPSEPKPVKLKKNGQPYKVREQKPAMNDKTRAHLYELLAQRITKYVEPQYFSDAMLRGSQDEIYARELYAEKYAPVEEVGFITNDQWGFTIGYSPDGLVGDDGLIECKSRCQKYQVQTIANGEVPDEYVIQLQTGLLVTGRKWCDFISYCGGLPMVVIRVHADDTIQKAIVAAAFQFEETLARTWKDYDANLAARRYFPTERRIVQEMFV